MEDRAWMRQALCREIANPEIFHPRKGKPVGEAGEICRLCPVAPECLRYALEHHEYGIWGGTSEKQRRQWGSRAGRTTQDARAYRRRTAPTAANANPAST